MTTSKITQLLDRVKAEHQQSTYDKLTIYRAIAIELSEFLYTHEETICEQEAGEDVPPVAMQFWRLQDQLSDQLDREGIISEERPCDNLY